MKEHKCTCRTTEGLHPVLMSVITFSLLLLLYDKNQFSLLEGTRVCDHPKQLAGPIINKHAKQ
jgi:hypothetical protein